MRDLHDRDSTWQQTVTGQRRPRDGSGSWASGQRRDIGQPGTFTLTGVSSPTEPTKKPARKPLLRKTIDVGQQYSGLIGAATGLAGTVIAVIALVVSCQASSQQARETAQAYASRVTYTPEEGQHNAPELVVSNPGDGVLGGVWIQMRGTLPPDCDGVCMGPFDVYAPNIPSCDTATIPVAALAAALKLTRQEGEQNAAASDLYFTDPTGHTWQISAATGELVQVSVVRPSPDANPYGTQGERIIVFRHIPGCV